MQTKHLAIAAAATVAGAYMVARWSMQTSDAAASQDSSTDTSTADILDMVTAPIKSALGLWRPPAQYADTIAQAEFRYSIPPDMLARLLYQECHWREDIITGRKTSTVGALGIAQFMPATAQEMGIDPLNPDQAIDGAGRYLRGLYRVFGNWTQALAAYNWGQGNVQRKGLANAPTETVNYYTAILGDVNAAHGTNYA